MGVSSFSRFRFFENYSRYFYRALVVFIFGAALWMRLSLPPVPFSDPDTLGYLFPSLSHLSNGVFCHAGGRAFPYPLFVDGILILCGTFNAINLVQHALGLLTGAILLVAWHRMFRFFPRSPLMTALHRVMSCVMLASLLLSREPMLMEHSIRPEAIFPFLAMAAIWLATEYCISFYLKQNLRAAFFQGAGLVGMAILLYFIKPAFGLGVGIAIVPVLVSCLQLKGRWAYRIGILALPILLMGSAVWYPEKVLVERYDQASGTFLSKHLFAFHAHVLRKEIADELEGRIPLAYDRQLMEKIAALMDKTLTTKSPHFPSLGYDADYFIYSPSVVEALMVYFKADTAQFNRFCIHYYLSGWRHYPLQMLKKVGWQMQVFYFHKTPFDTQTRTLETSQRATRSLLAVKKMEKPLPVLDRYIAGNEQLVGSKKVWKQLSFVSFLNKVLSWLYLLCAGAAVLVTASWVWSPRKPRGTWKPASLWFLYLMGYGFFNTLTVCIVHTVDVSRYVKTQLTYSLLAVGCGVLLLGMVWQRRQKSHLVAAGESTAPISH